MDILIVSSAFVPFITGDSDQDPPIDPCLPPEGWNTPPRNAAGTLANWGWANGWPETATALVLANMIAAKSDSDVAAQLAADSLAAADAAAGAEDVELEWRERARAAAYTYLGAHPETVIAVVHSLAERNAFPGWN